MSSARSGAAARAAALTARARALGAAQAEVHARTMGEVESLARAAARFFDALPLPEFSGTLLPASARAARRLRHRVLHQAMIADESGATLRALLLGRDAQLRMFTARSSVARDFISAVEPGQSPLGAGINRDVADWSPRQRLPEFRAADVLDRLSTALDAVETRLAAAERRVAAQRQALATGDLGAIRDSLGPSPAARPALGDGAARPESMRLTPGPGSRAVRSATAAASLPAPPRAALPAGAAVVQTPETDALGIGRDAPAAAVPTGDALTSERQGSGGDRAASATAPTDAGAGGPSHDTPPADSARETIAAQTRVAPDARPAPDVGALARHGTAGPGPSVAAPVQGTPRAGASWLSRAVRAAARTPAPTPLVGEVVPTTAGESPTARAASEPEPATAPAVPASPASRRTDD